MTSGAHSAEPAEMRAFPYRLWVNAERTVLVRLWPSGAAEVARRDSPGHTWDPPVVVTEEPL